MSTVRSSPFTPTDTVGDIIKHVIEDLGFQNLVDGQNKTEFGNEYGTEFNLRQDGDTIVRVIEIPTNGPDRSTVNSYLKRHGKKSNKELFSIIVRSEDSNSDSLQRPLNPEVTFIRIERQRATESVDIENDLKYFRVDIDDPSPMYLDYFNDMNVGSRSYNSVLESVEEIFSLKEITKSFYHDFAEIFQEELQNSIHGLENEDENLISHTQLVVNRILFLMFVQEKGWLNGNKKYIQNKYKDAKDENIDIYEEFFKPLFFEALNTEGIPQNDFIGKVPYLNGGLFEKKEIEKNVTIDDEFFDVLLSPEKNEYGVPEGFLLRYKLSLSESNPAEQELVVDPEFIGRIFEMFMQSEERSDKGAFYTPKEVTQYMSKNALKQYLLEDFPNNEAALSRLVSDYEVPENFSDSEIKDLRDRIKNIDVVDPAVGSGAFIISMLEELTEITEALNNVLGYEEDRFHLKEEFIARSLYGVDIDPSGIELCKFRTWLHLMQDLDNIGLDEFLKNNEKYALPNLGFKFFVGNSLAGDFKPTEIRNVLDNIGGDKSGNESMQTTIEARHTGGRDLADIVDEVDGKREEYLNAHGEEKNILEGQLSELIKEIDGLIDWESSDFWMRDVAEASESQFKWSVNIPEVILQGGFDIVIGNPPYKGVSGANDPYIGLLSDFYEEKYEEYDKTQIRKMRYDTYQKFIYRGLELTKKGGTLTYITSSTFFTIDTKIPARNLLLKNRLNELILGSPETFDATVTPAIFSVDKRNMTDDNYEIMYVDGYEVSPSEYRHLLEFHKSLEIVDDSSEEMSTHNISEELNSHIVSSNIYRNNSIKRAFFKPDNTNQEIYEKYIKETVGIFKKYKDEIYDVTRVKKNLDMLHSNHVQHLNAGDITLLGLVTWGGVGIQTGNNKEYMAYLDGTRPAKKVKERNEDCFKYVDKNEEGFGRLYRVIEESHIAPVEDLTEDEKKNGIDETERNGKVWVPVEKGFKKDDLYYKPHATYMDWSRESVQEIKNRNNGRLRDPEYYFRSGVYASRGGFSDLQVRYVEGSVIDSTGVVLLPVDNKVPAKYLVGLLNSELCEHIVDNFVNASGKQTADMRQIPIPIPTNDEIKKMSMLVDDAIQIKKGKRREKTFDKVEEEINSLTEQIYEISLIDDE